MKLLRHCLAIVGMAAVLSACGAADVPDPEQSPRHIIYLHGRIVEDQGLPAISDRYGEYRFDDIVAALGRAGFEVTAPIRSEGADPVASAAEISELVLEILDRGVPPENITIVGASKGAYIASLVSDTMVGPQLRYVLLAGCSDQANATFLAENRRLNGYVLTIRDRSDTALSGSCSALVRDSPRLAAFEEITTDTGLEHGLIYTPHEAWLGPSIDWAAREL